MTFLLKNQTLILIFNNFSLGDIFVVGGTNYNGFQKKSKTELMSIETWKWQTREPYPYATFISRAPSLFSGKSFYVFGGYNRDASYGEDKTFSTISSFTPESNSWKMIGSMKAQRHSASVVEVDDHFIIIGGYSDSSSTEICKSKDGRIYCEYQENSLTDKGINF